MLKLIPELAKHSLKTVKPLGSNRNLRQIFNSAHEETSKSLNEELIVPPRHRSSPSGPASPRHTLNLVISNGDKAKYEEEIKKLKEELAKSREGEEGLKRRIDKLDKENRRLKQDMKDFGVDAIKNSILKGNYQNMDEFVASLLRKKSSAEDAKAAWGAKKDSMESALGSPEFNNDKAGILR